jgi:hypothetical protein
VGVWLVEDEGAGAGPRKVEIATGAGGPELDVATACAVAHRRLHGATGSPASGAFHVRLPSGERIRVVWAWSGHYLECLDAEEIDWPIEEGTP